MGYIQEIRALIGTRPIIVVGASIILLDERKRLLLVHRADNKLWGLPAGLLELGESLEECARRELKEETGILATELEFFRVFSGPELFHKYPNGDEVYIVSTTFLARKYEGDARVNDGESLDLQFFPLDNLPIQLNPPSSFPIRKFIEHESAKMPEI